MTKLCVGHLRAKVPLRTSPAVGFTLRSFKLEEVSGRGLHMRSPCGACAGAKLPPKPVHVPSTGNVSDILGCAHRGCLCVYTGRSFSNARGFTSGCASRVTGTEGC